MCNTKLIHTYIHTYIHIYIHTYSIHTHTHALGSRTPQPPLMVSCPLPPTTYRTPPLPLEIVACPRLLLLRGLGVPHFPRPLTPCGTPPLLRAFDGTDDEDDDDNDNDVEHDVKDDPIVDSRRRLEQHNIMSSITGATAGTTANKANRSLC